jgi:hypothetical protein
MIKRSLILLAILISLLGCAKECDLAVYNNTPIQQTVKIDGHIFNMPANDGYAKETYFLNSYALWNDKINIPVEYVANSPVSYRSPRTFTVEMEPGKDRTYHVRYDRGQIQLRNISSITLDQVLLKTNNSEEWSEDLYEGALEPDGIDVIAVEEDNYTLKILDVYGTEYPSQEIVVIAGEQLMVIFTGEM